MVFLYLVPPWPPTKVPPHLCLSTASRIHAVSISQLPLVSPQLLACTIIWVQYLDFCFSSQQLLAFILVSVSNFPSQREPTASFSPIFCGHLASINIYMFPRFSQHLLACILSQYLNSPHPLPAFIFRSQKFPRRLSAFFFMYLHFVSMSRLHPSSLNNFLRSSCFNIELPLSPMCPSISCIHFASYVNFPHWPLHDFLRFYCFNTGTSPASTTSCMHLVSVSKFPAPCARSQKRCAGSKKEGAKVQKHPAQCERL